MHQAFSIVRTGAWLTRARIRLWATAMLVASLAGIAYLVATSDGLRDSFARPLATDFSNIYAAGTYVLEGRPAAPFDPAAQHAREQALFGADTPFYGWHYPPFFLFVAAALALMPYLPALALWQGTTFAFYLASIALILRSCADRVIWQTNGAKTPPPHPSPSPGRVFPTWATRNEAEHGNTRVRRAGESKGLGDGGASKGLGDGIARDRTLAAETPGPEHPVGWLGGGYLWLLVAAAFPAVFVNIGHGHNGFLTAALLGTALAVLDRRPALAGILIGLIAYKPQFGILIPLVLAATGRWRTFGTAAATVGALALLVTLAFGWPVWEAFFASTAFTRDVVLEAGDTGWEKIQSVFSAIRMWGGPVPLAYAGQATVTLAIAVVMVRLWRSGAPFPLKAAALATGSLLATPYALDYDLMALAPALAFLAADGLKRGFAPYEKSLLAAVWLVPLLARTVAQHTMVPLGTLAMLALMALICAKALRGEALLPAKAAG